MWYRFDDFGDPSYLIGYVYETNTNYSKYNVGLDLTRLGILIYFTNKKGEDVKLNSLNDDLNGLFINDKSEQFKIKIKRNDGSVMEFKSPRISDDLGIIAISKDNDLYKSITNSNGKDIKLAINNSNNRNLVSFELKTIKPKFE
jgi:hypothetical protein